MLEKRVIRKINDTVRLFDDIEGIGYVITLCHQPYTKDINMILTVNIEADTLGETNYMTAIHRCYDTMREDGFDDISLTTKAEQCQLFANKIVSSCTKAHA